MNTDYPVIVDASNQGNIARFVAHLCFPNCFTSRCVDRNGMLICVIHAIEDIEPNTELMWKYDLLENL